MSLLLSAFSIYSLVSFLNIYSCMSFLVTLLLFSFFAFLTANFAMVLACLSSAFASSSAPSSVKSAPTYFFTSFLIAAFGSVAMSALKIFITNQKELHHTYTLCEINIYLYCNDQKQIFIYCRIPIILVVEWKRKLIKE